MCRKRKSHPKNPSASRAPRAARSDNSHPPFLHTQCLVNTADIHTGFWFVRARGACVGMAQEHLIPPPDKWAGTQLCQTPSSLQPLRTSRVVPRGIPALTMQCNIAYTRGGHGAPCPGTHRSYRSARMLRQMSPPSFTIFFRTCLSVMTKHALFRPKQGIPTTPTTPQQTPRVVAAGCTTLLRPAPRPPPHPRHLRRPPARP
jgi:hypothetical protein